MKFFQTMPVGFIENITHLQFEIVVFCATLLATLTLIGATLYLFFRPIKGSGIFAPFKNFSDRASSVLAVCISVFVSWLVAFFLKNIFAIPRPFIINPDLEPLFFQSGFGFPSEHAAIFSALAVALFCINRKVGIVFGILALGIGVARIFAGVHSPLDILGGYIVGACIAGVIQRVSRKVI